MTLTLPRNFTAAFSALTLVCALLAPPSSFGRNICLEKSGSRFDSILIRKNIINKSYRIGLYPDAGQKVVFFTVKGMEGKVYQLYLFDLEGKLIKQVEIRNKQTTYISEIEKGVYVFDVFCDDDKIGNGQIAFR